MFRFRRNHWTFFRKATWLVIGWNLLMLVWLMSISGGTATIDGVESEGMTQLARGGAAFILFIIWFIGFMVTSLIWFGTRPRTAR